MFEFHCTNSRYKILYKAKIEVVLQALDIDRYDVDRYLMMS